MVSWKNFCIAFFLTISGIWGPQKSWSQEPPSLPAEETQSSDLAWTGEIRDGFNYLFKTVLSSSVQQPSDSTQNPHNDFLQIPRYTLKGEFRPDFSLDFRQIKLSIKPRFIETWDEWEDGPLKSQSRTHDDIYVTEWLASYKLHENWFVSYGRENLQWGPSFLMSPSNPFFRDNGQSNPKQEVKGMDFVRTVWVMNPAWTLSLIGNVGKGEQVSLYEFEPTYAIKMDYTTFRKYASLIGSYTENDRFHLGGFGGWTVSDGLMLYTEESLSAGTNVLYPRKIYLPLDLELIHMAAAKEDSSSPEAILLLGGSYTFESGQAVSAEYVFNSAGYSREEAELYYRYRRMASRFYDFPYPIGDLAKLALVPALDPKLRLLRQNYLMLQYQETQIWEKLSLVVRYTLNLDDTSSQLIPILGYDLGDHTQLFLIGNQNIGGTETEFGSFVEYGLILGIEYIF
ncbi:MAG: hypothetical protein HY881_08365 [Deltaproteobacteria bacterium]|nr:hypothetical protein [Deltaproteobacteria bacterium]